MLRGPYKVARYQLPTTPHVPVACSINHYTLNQEFIIFLFVLHEEITRGGNIETKVQRCHSPPSLFQEFFFFVAAFSRRVPTAKSFVCLFDCYFVFAWECDAIGSYRSFVGDKQKVFLNILGWISGLIFYELKHTRNRMIQDVSVLCKQFLCKFTW